MNQISVSYGDRHQYYKSNIFSYFNIYSINNVYIFKFVKFNIKFNKTIKLTYSVTLPIANFITIVYDCSNKTV